MSETKLSIRKQLGLLYISNFLFNSSIAGAAWVLLLVSDGYSLIQVGFAETVFHIVSLMADSDAKKACFSVAS